MRDDFRRVRPEEFLSADAGARITRSVHLEDGKMHVLTQQDVGPLLEANLRRRNAESGSWKGDMHHVASMSGPMYFELQRLGLMSTEEDVKKVLNDPMFAKLRTKTGKV